LSFCANRDCRLPGLIRRSRRPGTGRLSAATRPDSGRKYGSNLPTCLCMKWLVRGGRAVAFLPDLLWVEALPAICLRELPDSGYRDIALGLPSR
jgi:hypothetical protein